MIRDNERDSDATSEWKSVQAYIDETPLWQDGTSLTSTPMTRMQWRIWMLAAAGKFFEGLVVFMTGVGMQLIADEFHITAAQHGVGAASLFGILVGAIGLGGLSDYFGRKTMFVTEMIIFMVFVILLVASPSYIWLVIFLFGIGVALGCAAAFAKIGAVTTAFLFSILLASIGTQLLLYILVGTSLLSALVTWKFRIETTGVNLEKIGEDRGD